MVCECRDGTIQLWSLRSGKQVWVRPVIVGKDCWSDDGAWKKLPSSTVCSCYRSVVFHPEEHIVLPGVLRHAYNFDGDLKPLFPQSLCRFTVCSISGDKTTMLTDCPDDAKCIILWSLKNGTEITRTMRNDDVLSFAWSQDGKLLAISHSMGLICFVDVRDGFKTVAEHHCGHDQVCGMIKFTRDCRSLFCFRRTVSGLSFRNYSYRLNVDIAEHLSCTLFELSDFSRRELESASVAGFLFGDSFLSTCFKFEFLFHVDALTVLRGSPHLTVLEILKPRPNGSIPVLHTPPPRPVPRFRFGARINMEFSLTGETLYVSSDGARNAVATAWDISSEEPVGQVDVFSYSCLETRMKKGVLLSTAEGCLEMWNFELSNCLRRWPDMVQPLGTIQTIPISEDRVAISSVNIVIILNTTTSEIVTIPVYHGDFVTCNSKCQLLTCSSDSFQLLNGRSTLWKTDLHPLSGDLLVNCPIGAFSLSEQFVVVSAKREKGDRGMYVLDTCSGRILRSFCQGHSFSDCKFVSDEECVILSQSVSEGSILQLFNVESGELLSVIDLERVVSYLAVCPRKRLLAIDQFCSELGFELIQVHLPRDKDSRNNKR